MKTTARSPVFPYLLVAALALPSACSKVYEYPEPGAEATEGACADRVDNDFDGAIDCDDPNCTAVCSELTTARCTDARDNDADGLADCGDPDCRDFCPEVSALTCNDGRDNDFDGHADCDDAGCDGHCPEDNAAACDDGRDNDEDGLLDEGDPSCWPLRPPTVERCAASPGGEFLETFDAWPEFGAPEEWFVDPGWFTAGLRFGKTSERADSYLTCDPDAPDEPDALSASQSCVAVRTWPVSGTWTGFELSFTAILSEGAELSVGLVPVDLAPARDVPFGGAELALLSVTLDTRAEPPFFAVDFGGDRASRTLPALRRWCAGQRLCDSAFGFLRLRIDEASLRVTLTLPEGDVEEITLEAHESAHVPPIRLVTWANANPGDLAGLDDLELRMRPEYPCGFPVPQIPTEACAREGLPGFGKTVSMARDEDGRYCALVAGDDVSERLTAFGSEDGVSWKRTWTDSAEAPLLAADRQLLGASLVRDDSRFRAAITYQGERDTQVAFSSSSGCDAWSELSEGPMFGPDAEAASLVVDDDRYELYFTRPPAEGHRTLWRSSSSALDGSFSEPVQLAELSEDVGSPVSVQRVGLADRVLLHAMSSSAGRRGIALLVGDREGLSWRPAGASPWLEASTRERIPGVPLAFDDRGILAATLAWDGAGEPGLLLYSGVSEVDSEPRSRLGTARLGPADTTPLGGSVAGPSCGDSNCDAAEGCDSCPDDCPCSGTERFDQLLWQSERWQRTARDEFADSVTPVLSVDPAGKRVNFLCDRNTRLLTPLDRPLDGDFELSFDLWVDSSAMPTLDSSAAGAVLEVGLTPSLSEEPGDGIYVALTFIPELTTRVSEPVPAVCPEKYVAEPVIRNGASTLKVSWDAEPAADACAGGEYGRLERRERLTLERKNGRLSVRVAHPGSCAETSRSVEVPPDTPPLRALVVQGGGYAALQPVAGAISKLSLRVP